ncbi:DNA translocase FtsK 4TM domain-containing protein [Moraxella sp. Tifton1]|nr:DNA translocase FtsK [Moraxella sp. Tifton1]MCL1623245.1 DNA translocase FtsK 4TM domain-containing protein [Moraxella sp. Tifton1]
MKLLQYDFVNRMLGHLPTIKRLFFSVIGGVFFVFLFIALFSYDPMDSAWSHMSSRQSMTNVGGRLGAWTADIFRSLFGIGAWFLVAVLGYELVRSWQMSKSVFWPLRLIAYAFLLLCISAMLAYLGVWWSADPVIFGGMLGYELMMALVGMLGVALSVGFLTLFGFVIATLTFDIRWSGLWRKSKHAMVCVSDGEKQEMDNHEECHDESSLGKHLPKTPVYPSHNHEGALESFLVNSGLRDDLIAKKHDEQHEQHNTKTADINQVMEVLWADKDTLEAFDQSDQMNESSVATAITDDMVIGQDVPIHRPVQDVFNDDGNEVFSQKPNLVVSCDTTDEEGNHPINEWQQWHDDAAKQEVESPTPILAVSDVSQETNTPPVISDTVGHLPASMATGTVRPKSHAMSTLEYRMSLSPVPSLDILDPKPQKFAIYTSEQLQELSELLEIKLQEFNIKANVVSAMVGPVVTRFEVDLAAGVKASRVIKIAQDLARSLSMTSLRVIPVIAGKPYIGIEVPNKKRQIVSLLELLDTKDYQDPNAGISIAIGADINGNPVIADLAKAPHMLVAGTTGSGKSVLVNSFLMSMLLKYTPEELRLVLIDPKQLELANYGDIPHLLTPVIIDMTEATAALNWCVTEMERRYLLMSKLRVRNIAAFNQKIKDAQNAGEPILDLMWNASDHVSDSVPQQKTLSKIVVVADEFADMIMQLGKTAEEPIVRLAQKSRAAGIHLILATQRPVATVVTGLIKSNIPVRVALRVNSATDSRIIIEESGAENMLGHGDMMFLAPGAIETVRVHGAFVKDDEVNRVTDAWRERGAPDYIDLSESYTFEGEGSGDTSSGGDDEYFDLSVSHILETRKVSISALQRKFSIGYNRAARIVDMMEERGIVSAADNNGKRQILM